jgi:hypothetical protein
MPNVNAPAGATRNARGYHSRVIRFAVLFWLLPSCAAQSGSDTSVMTVCQLSRDYSGHRNRIVTVRGIYYYGLRQECRQKCAIGPWPSFIDLSGGAQGAWDVLNKAQAKVETDAKRTGRRFELWVTVTGQLRANAKESPLGPCDRSRWGGFGHLGAFPAQIAVGSVSDIEIKVNPHSPYDYANMYHGPL